MTRTSLFAVAGLVAAAGLAIAQPAKDKPAPGHTPHAKPASAQPAGQPEMQLPPGWTPADMQACIAAGTPGEQHAKLAADAGVWQGKTKMWMAPGTEPMESTVKSTITPILDGRFVKCQMEGEMPGMGPFSGFGVYGFDNVTQKYQATWIDNCSTTIMMGTGEASSSGDTMTWKYNSTCPLTKKPTTMREVDKNTGKDSKVMEMYTIDPKSGKEYKMMEVTFTRTGPAPAGHASVPTHQTGG